MDENLETPNSQRLPGACDLCQIKKEFDEEHFQEADWNDMSVTQLEETVLNNLEAIFEAAIRKVASCGYSEEVATNSVLNATGWYRCDDTVLNSMLNAIGWYGCKDMVLNIVENALAVLRNEEKMGPSLAGENLLAELNKMERSVLNEMINVVRNFWPNFSRGDAMWRLLMNDMNVSLACSSDCNSLSSIGSEENSVSYPVPRLEQEYNSNSYTSSKLNVIKRFSAKESVISSIGCMVEETSSVSISSLPQGRSTGGKKGQLSGSSSKRESILRQKSVHFEKSYRMFGAKAVIRTGKHNSFGGLLLDKKSLMKLHKKAIGTDKPPQADLTCTVLSKSTDQTSSCLPVVNTGLSLSPPMTDWVPQDKMDEMLLKLVLRVKELDAQLREWSDWANQKVMQAARRLGKDKAERQSLHQEKDEVVRLKKEKQSLEQNTRKRLSEMEIALSKTTGQVEKSNAEARDLEEKNARLRKEMEAAKLQAAESAVSCQEVSKREMETRKSLQSWEKQKEVIQQELTAERQRFFQIQQNVKQIKEQLDRIKAKWKQEEAAKEKALTHLNHERREREQIEISGRSAENALHLKAATELQRHKDEMKKLEHQIAQMRQRTDSSMTAAPKWGSDSKYSSKLLDVQKAAEEEDVQRERECAICLTEEICVVFLPCAHEILCSNCNEIHEKHGEQICPQCRTPIQARICVRFPDS